MSDQTTDAVRLRAAATLLREVAEDAPPGPWRYSEHGNHMDGPTEVWVTSPVSDDPMLSGGYDSFSGYAAVLAASMSPPVALALADWLDALAQRGEDVIDSMPASWGVPDGSIPGWEEALAVADAVLGGGER